MMAVHLERKILINHLIYVNESTSAVDLKRKTPTFVVMYCWRDANTICRNVQFKVLLKAHLAHGEVVFDCTQHQSQTGEIRRVCT